MINIENKQNNALVIELLQLIKNKDQKGKLKVINNIYQASFLDKKIEAKNIRELYLKTNKELKL